MLCSALRPHLRVKVCFYKCLFIIIIIICCCYFYTAFCSKLFTICQFVTTAYVELRDLYWFVNKLFGVWYALLLCPFINKSDSSTVEGSSRNPWIGGSNPGGNYFPFHYDVEWIFFPPKNVHLVVYFPQCTASKGIFCTGCHVGH